MARHSARSRAGFGCTARSARVRALLSLGIVLGFGAPGTLAYWSDEATMTGATFTAGNLNMRLDDNEGNPTAWANTAFTLSAIVPGESVAASFPVQNVGDVGFTYTATGTATGTLVQYLTFQTFVGGVASNGPVGGLRTGTCGGTSTGAPQTLNGTAQAVVASPQQVNAAASQSVCFVVKLSNSAPSAAQGQSGTGTFVFTANQIGAP